MHAVGRGSELLFCCFVCVPRGSLFTGRPIVESGTVVSRMPLNHHFQPVSVCSRWKMNHNSFDTESPALIRDLSLAPSCQVFFSVLYLFILLFIYFFLTSSTVNCTTVYRHSVTDRSSPSTPFPTSISVLLPFCGWWMPSDSWGRFIHWLMFPGLPEKRQWVGWLTCMVWGCRKYCCRLLRTSDSCEFCKLRLQTCRWARAALCCVVAV